ncbi:MAG: PEP-CTERM sorting domain-containing protein [Planctomycetes bacterium]|nr:PEP-CTERM sorting domain-containing protein [Planctomycetota bacterium]
MKRSCVALFTGAVAALLFAGSSARADFVQWRYNWTPSTLKVVSDTSATSFVQLTNEPLNRPTGVQVSGDSDIQMTNVKVVSDAPRAAPDTFNLSAPVLFSLRLTDVASGAFADLPFTMKFLGDVSAESSHLRLDPASTATTYSNIHLGNNIYGIDSVDYTPPGPPGSDNSGSISASVTVRPLNISKVPEPSTMVLSMVGLSFLGLSSWRKRRQKATA